MRETGSGDPVRVETVEVAGGVGLLGLAALVGKFVPVLQNPDVSRRKPSGYVVANSVCVVRVFLLFSPPCEDILFNRYVLI